jgi:Tfp pilus assembly protein PilF
LAELYFHVPDYKVAIAIYKELHNITKVEKCYEKMMEIEPNNPIIREDYGDFIRDIGLYEKAAY